MAEEQNVVVLDYSNSQVHILLVPKEIRTIDQYQEWLAQRFNINSIDYMISNIRDFELYIERGSVQYTNTYASVKSEHIYSDNPAGDDEYNAQMEELSKDETDT